MHTGRRLTAVVAAGAASLALVAAACSSSSTPDTAGGPAGTPLGTAPYRNAPKEDGAPRDGGTLRFGLEGETDGYNPLANNFSISGNLVASAVYDPLMRINADRVVEPYLAASVTPNADATVWTIKARPGVRFHDGTPFDGRAIFLNVDGRTKSALNSIALEPVKEVAQVDDMTVEVRMKRPWVAYDYTLAAQGGYMVAPATIADPEGAKHPIGTGPFQFVSWTPGDTFQAKRNPTYWQAGQPHLDGITFRVLADPQARSKALEAGDVDAIVTDRAVDVGRFRDEPGYVQAEDLAGEETFVMLNSGRPPLDDLDARLALAYATDRRSVVQVQTDGLAPEADQPYTESERWYVPDAGYVPFDPAKAKEHLDAYLARSGQTALSFELKTSSSPQMMEQLQQQWASVGIQAKITQLSQATFIQNVVLGDYQAAYFRNFAYVDPDSNYIFWHSSTAKGVGTLSINFTQTKDAELDAALDKGRSTKDAAARKDAYATVVRRLNANVPYLWLYHNLWAIIANDKVAGLAAAQAQGFGRQDAKTWWGQLWLRS